jgi:hypothetical protein
MTEYQDQSNLKASEYALRVALDVPFMSIPMADLMVRFRWELRLAFLAGVEFGVDKDFQSTARQKVGGPDV